MGPLMPPMMPRPPMGMGPGAMAPLGPMGPQMPGQMGAPPPPMPSPETMKQLALIKALEEMQDDGLPVGLSTPHAYVPPGDAMPGRDRQGQ